VRGAAKGLVIYSCVVRNVLREAIGSGAGFGDIIYRVGVLGATIGFDRVTGRGRTVTMLLLAFAWARPPPWAWAQGFQCLRIIRTPPRTPPPRTGTASAG
jgi:hypothetical protein